MATASFASHPQAMSHFDFAAARAAMIETQLRPGGVRDIAVLRAFATVPREIFLPEDRRFLAYSDKPIRLDAGKSGRRGRALLPPVTMARLLQQAGLGANAKVLDVGSATGYSAAILSKLAGEVIALEEDEGFARTAERLLAELRADNVKFAIAPLADGAPEKRPFDAIFLNGGVEAPPKGLFGQLGEGGRLFAIVGPERDGEATIFTKIGDSVSRRPLFDASADILPGFEAKPVFVF
jgi:protein-L-isoaspartate(D-aspartate) O-methyltransferase